MSTTQTILASGQRRALQPGFASLTFRPLAAHSPDAPMAQQLSEKVPLGVKNGK